MRTGSCPRGLGTSGAIQGAREPSGKKGQVWDEGNSYCHLESASHEPDLSSSGTNPVPHSSSLTHNARQSHCLMCNSELPQPQCLEVPGLWKLTASSLSLPQITKRYWLRGDPQPLHSSLQITQSISSAVNPGEVSRAEISNPHSKDEGSERSRNLSKLTQLGSARAGT